MRKYRSSWFAKSAPITLPAFVGAITALLTSLFTMHFQYSTTSENLRSAFAGEIEAVWQAILKPTHFAMSSWDKNCLPNDLEFYYPHAVYDANVSKLGEIRDRIAVRDIVSLYSTLELARDEGRRIKAGTNDAEGPLRFVSYLVFAEGKAIEVAKRLADADSVFYVNGRIDKMKHETEFLTNASEKIMSAALGTKSEKANKVPAHKCK